MISRLRSLRDTLLGEGEDLWKMTALMALSFLVVCAIGILRPIKNALALAGLGDSEFYKVYVVSSAVVLFVPLYNWLADRTAWRSLMVAVSLAFAGILLVFRAFYSEGSALFGVLFYGWYDLLAAVMVTQFFMATQLYFDVRQAKATYPLIIAGASVGATVGGAVNGVAAETLGLPNLMLLAAVLVATFGLGLPFVLGQETDELVRRSRRRRQEAEDVSPLAMFQNAQVRRIAVAVLLTVLVKQLVDYQFNTITEEVFVDAASVSQFQGWFNAGTQWLPLVVLASLRPLLRRWGVGLAAFLLPVFMLGANLGLVASWSLVAAVAAKAGDTGLRYAAERTSRELLYLPVPDDLKLAAKSWIDIAVEKGVGKALSALLVFALLAAGVNYREVGLVAVVLTVVWLAVARTIKAGYVQTLAEALESRVASLRGVFVSLTDASTLPVVRQALRSDDPRRVAFALDLVDQAAPKDVEVLADDLTELLDRDEPEVRERALQVMARAGTPVRRQAVRERVTDPSPRVRRAAVRALVAAAGVEGAEGEAGAGGASPGEEGADGTAPRAEAHADRDAAGDGDPSPARESAGAVRELLEAEDSRARRAVLDLLARDDLPPEARVTLDPSYLEKRREDARGGDREARLELALAAGVVEDGRASHEVLPPLLRDPDPDVVSAALRSAARLGGSEYDDRLVEALGSPATRKAARQALVIRGAGAVPALEDHLLDEDEDPAIRRNVPRVLFRIPSQRSVDALLDSYVAPETDQLLDYRTLKALNKLRDTAGGDLDFREDVVREVLRRELGAARRYRNAMRTIREEADLDRLRTARLLYRTLDEAWEKRRESTFRCLGLLHDPDSLHRCYLAVATGGRKVHAQALEWLEESLGREFYLRLSPVLEEEQGAASRTDRGGKRDLARSLEALRHDNDSWIARCARRVARDLEQGPGEAARTPGQDATETTDLDVVTHEGREHEMDLIEKVFLLQNVDLLEGARSEELALMASVAEEVDVARDETLLQQGAPPEAMYIVVQGEVELRGRDGERILLASDGRPFGTWALIDEKPSLVDARATRESRLLRVTRGDFRELLADNPELALGLLRGLSRRIRQLVEV